VAREVMQTVSGGVKDFEPFVRFHTFGPTMTCTVTMSGREFADQFLIKHEFVKRLHDRFVREGIVVPGPKTVLDVKTPIHVRMVAPSDRPST
jgi:hypothetical protein